MTKYLSKLFILATALFSLVGCKLPSIDGNPLPAGKLYNFERILVKGGDFWITTYQKITDKSQPYVFYIEGDGAAWAGKYRVSNNPTPRRQMFIKLAAMDQRPNVVYVARPCQYTPMNLNPKCTVQGGYWTDKRMSSDSVDSLNEVINTINDNQKFSLVGYSGGGGLAVLIAARNHKTKDILTIAANLDHASFTYHHNVTPMIGSLNPINYAYDVKNIPQLHISGGKDDIIPPFIADKFIKAVNSNCAKQKVFPAISHNQGWEKIWDYILRNEPIRCYN